MNERIKELYLHAFPPSLNDSTTVQMSAEKFAELIVRDYANQLVQANMSNPSYAQAMDEYYENKWAHRFD